MYQKTVRLISPVNGELYAERPLINDDALDDALTLSRRVQTAWAKVPLNERIAYCRKALEHLKKHDTDIVKELAWQMGRPVRSGGENSPLEERFNYMSGIAGRALAPLTEEYSDRVRRYISRVPHGVVLVIAPWNYPYLTACNAIFPALISGNTVVLKHAVQTLLVGERLQQAFDASGIPAGVFQNLVLDHAQTEKIISSRRVNFVNFTGSVYAGQVIERAAAGQFIGVGLELGGKDPAYVCEDADIEKTAEMLIDGAFFNSGQCCCGIERIYAAKPVYEKFLEKCVSLTKSYVLGNPLEQATTIGPMAQARYAEGVRKQISAAVSAGARTLIDPALFPADKPGSAYVAPQIVVDVSHDMEIMTEENFGPVVGIMPVSSDAEAIKLMNDSHYGLTASVWTSDMARAERIGEELDTGTIFMNRCDYVDPALCWTGCKDTGRGVTMSEIGFHQLTRPKSHHLRKF
ncbi:hypothetical protein CHS0354_018529 [Potamilus streckersoni]|uniref:Aldehyde dehydrogenase domain-containing protein n=1 Tax=Potamilus streckersoni TaxID=2493646 RepID=A0AAE0TBF3_9BIVA|nr:hypothetical protein CHS0354_018529 [Potamilus streckersoni]